MDGLPSGTHTRHVGGGNGPSHCACWMAYPPRNSREQVAIRAKWMDKSNWYFPCGCDHLCIVSRKIAPKCSRGTLDDFSGYDTLCCLGVGMGNSHLPLSGNAR